MKSFIPTYLYIKQHSITGLLYFGKTTKDPLTYNGSGTYWKRHIKSHGHKHIKTIWHYLFDEVNLLNEFALFFSEEFDIVNSSKWANLRDETGLDGGDTSQSLGYKQGMAKRRSYVGKNNPRFGKPGGMFGKNHSKSSKEKSSNTHKKLNENEEYKRKKANKIKGSNNGMFNKTPTNAVQVYFREQYYPSIAKCIRENNIPTSQILKEIIRL